MKSAPPDTYEDLIQAIHDGYDSLSKSYKAIARFLTQNPNEVAMLSVGAIAGRCQVHASSLVRFAQHFGFNGFKDLQVIFYNRLSTAAPGFDARVRSLADELQLYSHTGLKSYLAALVARDITSLQQVLEETDEAAMERAVGLMEAARTIYVLGQLRSEPIAQFIRYVGTMLKRKVTLLDANGGLATEMAKVIGPDDLLIAISFRYYAKEVVNITAMVHGAGVPTIVISDSTLSPLAKSASVLFPIPEDEYSFSRSLAAPMCLAQAMMIALASRSQKGGRGAPHIPVATEPGLRG